MPFGRNIKKIINDIGFISIHIQISICARRLAHLLVSFAFIFDLTIFHIFAIVLSRQPRKSCRILCINFDGYLVFCMQFNRIHSFLQPQNSMQNSCSRHVLANNTNDLLNIPLLYSWVTKSPPKIDCPMHHSLAKYECVRVWVHRNRNCRYILLCKY